MKIILFPDTLSLLSVVSVPSCQKCVGVPTVLYAETLKSLPSEFGLASNLNVIEVSPVPATCDG